MLVTGTHLHFYGKTREDGVVTCIKPSKWGSLVACLAAAGLIASACSSDDPQAASTPPRIELQTSKRVVDFGAEVLLSGTVSPAKSGQRVEITNEDGSVMSQATTGADGTFSARLTPEKNSLLIARWAAAESESVPIRVRPVVEVVLSKVQLFSRARVRGTIDAGGPLSTSGRYAVVELLRGKEPVAKKMVGTDGTRFSAAFPISEAGSYRARVSVRLPELKRASTRSSRSSAVLPELGQGSSGRAVLELERRLEELGYYLTGVDGTYDERTSDAVLAFHKVNGRERIGTVDAGTWRALADPVVPEPRDTGGDHVEVDQTKQVFYTVEDGEITNIVHVSTGADNATIDGRYTIYKKGGIGREYYPSYFHGARAFHAWASVPPYGASAGCVRLPFWAADWYWDQTPIGTEVMIYH